MSHNSVVWSPSLKSRQALRNCSILFNRVKGVRNHGVHDVKTLLFPVGTKLYRSDEKVKSEPFRRAMGRALSCEKQSFETAFGQFDKKGDQKIEWCFIGYTINNII